MSNEASCNRLKMDVPVILQRNDTEEHRVERILLVILAAFPALLIVVGTIAGNVIVCVAIVHNRQLRKNITNSFCASLAIR